MMSIKSVCLLVLAMMSWSFYCDGQNVGEWKKQSSSKDEFIQLEGLINLNKYYNQVSLDSAVMYGLKALNISNRLGIDTFEIKSHINLTVSFYYSHELDSMLHHANTAVLLGQAIHREKEVAFAYKMLSIAYRKKGLFETALDYSKKGIQIYEETEDTLSIASVYLGMGNICVEQGDYDQAFTFYYKSEKLFSIVSDTEGRGVALAVIANTYLDLDEKDKARPFLFKARSILKDSFPYQYIGNSNTLGVIYHDEMELDSALFYFNECLGYYVKLGDQEGVGMAHVNLGNVFRDMKKWKESYVHLLQAMRIYKQINDPTALATLHLDLGIYHDLTGQKDSARYCFETALGLVEDNELVYEKGGVLKQLYLLNKNEHNYSKSLEYHEQYLEHVNDIKGIETEKEIAGLEARYESEKQGERIERLELESILESSKTNTFRTSLLALGVVFLLILMGLLYRRKSERKLFALKQKVHEEEKNKLDQELTFKTKQLTSHALHMVQKNKVLQELKSGINEVAKNANIKNKKALSALIRRIDFNIHSDEDWNTFKLYFEQTNQHFYANLAEINKNLTSTELKLCSLIKLNMNIKETASVLNIEPTSVKTARHRLRKKLNLAQGQDLAVFIRQVA